MPHQMALVLALVLALVGHVGHRLHMTQDTVQIQVFRVEVLQRYKHKEHLSDLHSA